MHQCEEDEKNGSTVKKYRDSTERGETESGDELQVDTIDMVAEKAEVSEHNDTVHTGTENEDLILENVQNFINMAYLQKSYLHKDISQTSSLEPVYVDLQPHERLLLLDMDETLIHAATTIDIEENKIYGQNAKPDFYTHFID